MFRGEVLVKRESKVLEFEEGSGFFFYVIFRRRSFGICLRIGRFVYLFVGGGEGFCLDNGD